MNLLELITWTGTFVFALTGALKARASRMDIFGGAVMAFATAYGGGTLRDLLIGEIPLVFRRQTYLYATAAFGGAALYILFKSMGLGAAWLMVAGTTTTLALRLAGIRWGIALPVYQAVKQGSKPAQDT